MTDQDIKKYYLNKNKLVGKILAVIVITVFLLMAIPLGLYIPSVGSVTAFNVYRVTGGFHLIPQNLTDGIIIFCGSLGFAIYFVFIRKRY